MLFGKSVFQSILTRLDHEAPDEEPVVENASFRISGLNAGFVAPIETAEVPVRANHAYLDLLADLPAADQAETAPDTAQDAPTPPPMPAFLARLSEAEVEEDLALELTDTSEILAEKRRSFAKLNHPDLVHPDFRRQATIRMTIANMLVDRAQRLTFFR
jgi:hypothetical protein